MTDHRIVPTQDRANHLKIADQTASAARASSADSLAYLRKTALLLLGAWLLSVSVCAQSAAPPVPAAPDVNDSGPLQFPVAHAHFGSWCMGYLTITPEEVRYQAVGSHGKDEHSFQMKREQVLFLNYWVLASQPMNAVEIRTANKNYHFWLMQSAADLQVGAHSAWRPVAAAPSDTLLVSLYYWRVTGNVPSLAAVTMALVQARADAANAAMAQASAPGSINDDVLKKVNDHLYVNNYSSSVTSHTINTINHISHW